MVAKLILYLLIALLAFAWMWIFQWTASDFLQAVMILFSIIACACFCKCHAH